MQITYADLLKEIPKKLETISFMIGIKESIVETFHALKEILLAQLEEKKILQLKDKKLKELVAFYLILELAPNPYSEGEI